MLVRRDLGFPSLVFLVVVFVVVPVIVLIIRRKWRHSVARREEIKRLVVSAAEELARAEFEAREAYYYNATATPARVSVSTPVSVPISVSVPSGSTLKPQYQCAACFRPATRRCANCKAVRYCTGKCQVNHWRQVHKYECRPYVDVVSPSNDESFDQQSCSSSGRFSEDLDDVHVGVGSESLNSPLGSNKGHTPTKFPVGEKLGRKSTGLGKKSQKRSNPSDAQTNNGSLEPEVCTTTSSDNKKKIDDGENENVEKVMDGLGSKSSDGCKSNHRDVATSKSKSWPSGDDKTFVDVSNNKPKSKEDKSVICKESRAPDTSRHASKSISTKVDNHIRSGSKTSKSKIVEPDKYAFKGLFPYEMFVKLYASKKMELQPFGLKNCGNSCYANAVLQCLIYTPPLTAYFLEGLHSRACDKRGWCFTCEVEGLVMKAKDGNTPLSPIRILTHIENIGHGKEEDAHEFLRYVIDALQVVCNSSEEETTLVGLTFGGHLRSKIICIKCGGKSEQHERMMDLSVEIQGDIATLEQALDKFTCTEILDGENKYKCTRCKSYEKARKKLTLLEAPNVLTIALKRFQCGKYGKINKSIEFPEILDMAPYVSGTSDKSPVYRLYGVVVHVDSMNDAFSGHYVSYVKNLQNRWFKFNDSIVNEVDLQHVLTKGAYMLFYARCSPRAPRSIRNSIIQQQKNKTFVGTWDACNYRHRSLEEESSSSSSDNSSGFFSESSCSWGDWNTVTSSDSDTSSTSSFPSPLYSRLSHLYTSRTNHECRKLDCSKDRVTNLDTIGTTPFRRSATRGGKSY